MKSAFLLLLIGFSQTVFAQQNCPSRSSLPRCAPGGSNMVAKHEPAMIMFLSASSSRENTLNVLEDTLGTPTRIGVTEGFVKSMNENKDPAVKARWEKLRGQVISFKSNADILPNGTNPYIRDETIFGYNQATQTIERTSIERPEWMKFQKDFPAEVCGVKMQPQRMVIPQAQNKDRGGNIMGLPGGVCASTSGINAKLADNTCGKGSKRLAIDGRFARVGHIDELFNVVPDKNKKPPCDFSVVMASSDKMKEVLRENPGERFISDEALKGVNSAEKRNCNEDKCYRVTDFCKILDSVLYLNQLNDDLILDPSGGDAAPEDGRTEVTPLPKRYPAGALTIGAAKKQEGDDQSYKAEERKHFGKLYGIDERYKASGCEKMTNRQVLMAMEASQHFGQLRDWLKKNEKRAGDRASLVKKIKEKLNDVDGVELSNADFMKTQKANWEKIKAALPAACRKDSQKTELAALYSRGHQVSPNPTNLQVAGKSAMTPQQLNPAIERSIGKSLQGLGLNPRPLDSFYYHSGGGNIHCTSNEIRVCQ